MSDDSGRDPLLCKRARLMRTGSWDWSATTQMTIVLQMAVKVIGAHTDVDKLFRSTPGPRPGPALLCEGQGVK